MATWKDDVFESLNSLNRKAHLADIYKSVSEMRKCPNDRKLQTSVRATLGIHSKDSSKFRGINLFKSYGDGWWSQL